jgi:hypothetical protein
MNITEVVAAGLVGALLLWMVAQPMLQPSMTVPEDLDLPDPEETPRGQALLALKEIEFDRATGKLSDSDYEFLKAKYTTAALAAIEPARENLQAHCLVHGPRAESGAIFCAECGAGLVNGTNHCISCGFAVTSDAVFCPGCGVRVR